MTMRSLVAFAAIIVPIVAFPGGPGRRSDDPRFTTWTAPGPNDVRSPCPGLNTLANHGFINHSGKNLTVPHLIEGLKAGMNFGADFSSAIGNVGLLSSAHPEKGSFDLNELDQHNFPLEHDASLSRQDAYFGNDYSFYQPNWNMVLNAYTGKTITDIPTASKAKWARVQDSKKRNPTLTYGFYQAVISYGDVALYLQSMGDTLSGKTRLDYVRSLFEKEKLPYDLGWRPSTNEITLFSLGQMIVELYASSPAPFSEGFLVGADTYKDVLIAIRAGRQIVANQTLTL